MAKMSNDFILCNQDPLRASDKALMSCGPYKMKEDETWNSNCYGNMGFILFSQKRETLKNNEP